MSVQVHYFSGVFPGLSFAHSGQGFAGHSVEGGEICVVLCVVTFTSLPVSSVLAWWRSGTSAGQITAGKPA